jgi:heme/copper-type cytochrome/quinol oxidase subunit 2
MIQETVVCNIQKNKDKLLFLMCFILCIFLLSLFLIYIGAVKFRHSGKQPERHTFKCSVQTNNLGGAECSVAGDYFQIF